MLGHVLLALTVLLALQNQKNAHQGHSATKLNSSPLNSVRTVLQESTVGPSTWSSQQHPVEKGTTVPQVHLGLTRLSALLEDIALKEISNLSCAPMELTETSLREYLLAIASTVHLDITAKVLG